MRQRRQAAAADGPPAHPGDQVELARVPPLAVQEVLDAERHLGQHGVVERDPLPRGDAVAPCERHDLRVRHVGQGYAPPMRVAALYDVHGMLPALEAVLAEVEREDVDLLVFGGDLTWGPWPAETAAFLQALDRPARFVQGNAEVTILDLTSGREVEVGDGGRWIAASHDADALAFVRAYEPAVVVQVDGLGPVRFVHGSPRSVIEIVTPETPLERLAEAFADVPERTVVSGHCHLQFDRPTPLARSLNPGSIGLPYHHVPGACWALLGPDVELRVTPIDRDALAARIRETAYPDADRIAGIVLDPPTVAEVVDDGERRVFSN